MAAFPDADEPHEFILEHANALGVEFFAAIITATAGAQAWRDLNREQPVRLFLLDGLPALHWWEFGDRRGTSSRSHQVTHVIPDWLWEQLRTETTAEKIMEALV